MSAIKKHIRAINNSTAHISVPQMIQYAISIPELLEKYPELNLYVKSPQVTDMKLVRDIIQILAEKTGLRALIKYKDSERNICDGLLLAKVSDDYARSFTRTMFLLDDIATYFTENSFIDITDENEVHRLVCISNGKAVEVKNGKLPNFHEVPAGSDRLQVQNIDDGKHEEQPGPPEPKTSDESTSGQADVPVSSVKTDFNQPDLPEQKKPDVSAFQRKDVTYMVESVPLMKAVVGVVSAEVGCMAEYCKVESVALIIQDAVKFLYYAVSAEYQNPASGKYEYIEFARFNSRYETIARFDDIYKKDNV